MKKILFEHPWKSAFLPHVVILIIYIFVFIFGLILPIWNTGDPVEVILLLINKIIIILFPIWLIFGLVVSKEKLPYILSILIVLLIITFIYILNEIAMSDAFRDLQCKMNPSKC